MEDVAEGAHRGMTVQMEHTPCEDPLTDEAAVVNEFDFILLFSLVIVRLHYLKFLCKFLHHMLLQQLCTYNLHILNNM